MNDWYLSTNQLVGICEEIRVRTYFYGCNVNLVWIKEEGDEEDFFNFGMRKFWKKGYMYERKQYKRMCEGYGTWSFFLFFFAFTSPFK